MTTVSIRSFKKYIRCQKQYYTPEMQNLLQNLPCRIQNPVKVLKDDLTSTVVVVKVDEHYVVVKRSNAKNWTHFIRRLFSISRAQKNWSNAQILLNIGVQTFYPIALMEERWGPFRGRCYFICSYIQGIEALQYFSKEANTQSSWGVVTTEIKNMLSRLTQHWISHRDLNLSNIILVDNQPWLIDLDSMRQHYFKIFARRGARRELERFMQNWVDVKGRSYESLSLFQSIIE